MYEKGQGLDLDYAEAVKWYRKAADQGDAWAQTNLGAMYANGQGVSQDYTEALRWYRKAAEQGFARAQNNLGVMYNYGQGVGQDYKQAVYWYQKAIESDGNDADTYNQQAWLLATCKIKKYRDGDKAVDLAKKADPGGGHFHPAKRG
jgi:TPR repeat protein